MITFHRENLMDIRGEIQPLIERHWEEVALDRDVVKLDPQWDMYAALEDAGAVCCVTARDGDILVGYAIYLVFGHLHYRSLRVADSDVFFLAPEYRKGTTGLRLFKAAEAELRGMGANKVVNKVKLHKDVGRVFERMGYKPIERVYVKTLEG